MTWPAVIAVVSLVLAVGVVVESLRREPWLPRSARAPAPSQRRWTGLGISLISAGLLLSALEAGATPLQLGLVILGWGMLFVGVLKRPTAEEAGVRARKVSPDGS